MSEKIVIVGAGGQAGSVLDILEACNAERTSYEVLGYVVDPEYAAAGTLIRGLPVLGGVDWFATCSRDVRVVCGVGAPKIRHRLVAHVAPYGVDFVSVVHPTVIQTRWVTIGPGAMIGAGCILTRDTQVGMHAVLNIACTVGHGSQIGSFATLSPGVRVAGNVAIGEGVFLGIGACLIERVRIGPWSVVGAGAAVVGDLPPNTTSVGVPAKVIKFRPNGWQMAER